MSCTLSLLGTITIVLFLFVGHNASVQSQNNAPKASNTRPEIDKGSGKIIRYVKPEYPKQLREKHVEGVVHLRVLVGKNGTPKKITYVNGPKELLPFARNAVKQWRYQPLSVNGQRLEFTRDELISFNLSQ